ncbi:MAG: hypothetical protein LRZ84_21665 [Desertifilum sp.]|nr:hypothetical protein [Desertifilum sp.]
MKELTAERALQELDFSQDISERQIWIALSKFAGSELLKRQRLQAAQKSQVTKKDNQIKTIESNHAATIDNFEKKVQKERNEWRQMLNQVYSFANKFGFRDAMIEKIIKQDDAA